MVKLMIGKSCSGKTTYIKNQIKEKMKEKPPEKKILVIVPEQSTLLNERDFINSLSNRASAYMEVLSFKRLANRVFTEVGGVAGKYADKTTTTLIMAATLNEVAEELTVFGNCSKKQDVIEELIRLMTELKSYEVTSSQLGAYALVCEGTLRLKLLDTACIYDRYCEILNSQFKDPRDDLTRLGEKLEQCDFLAGREVYFDGFAGYTPQEQKVIAQIFTKAQNVTITLTMDGAEADADVFFMPCKTKKMLLKLCEELNIEAEEIVQKEQYGYTKEVQFLQKHLFNEENVALSGLTENIKLFDCTNVFEEVEMVANEIERLVKDEGYHYKDILIVARDIGNYSDTIDAVFHRHNIPIFLDRKNSILTKPVMMAVLTAMELLTYHFTYETVFRYLKTGLTGIADEEVDRLENYAIKWNIRGSKWEKPFAHDPAQKNEHWSEEETQEETKKIEALRKRFVTPVLKLKVAMSKKKTTKERATALYEFLISICLPQNIAGKVQEYEEQGELAIAGEYKMLWDIAIEVLDQLVDVMGEEVISFVDFYEILKSVLSAYDIGLIPTSLDEVSAAGSDRVRAKHTRCVMLIGVNDGSVPQPQMDDAIFSDMEKGVLEESGITLSPTSRDKMFMELYYIYAAISFAKERLYFFYESSDMTGGVKFPSYIIRRVKTLFPSVGMIEGNTYFDGVEHIYLPKKGLDFLALYKNKQTHEGQVAALEQFFANHPSQEYEAATKNMGGFLNTPTIEDKQLVKAVFGEVMEKSASRIERYYNCKFSYFMQYALHANKRAKVSFSAMEMGTFVHYVLEQFFLQIEEMGKKLGDLTEQEGRTLVAGSVRKFIDENTTMKEQSARANYLFRRLVDTVYAVVGQLMEEFKNSEFEPIRFELSMGGKQGDIAPLEFETPNKTTIRIVGKVDRVDGFQKDGKLYVKIVDYKTGKKEFDFSDVYSGLSVQMLIYLFAIWQNGEACFHQSIMPGGLLYFHAHNPMLELKKTADDEQIAYEMQKKYKMSGIVLEDEDIINAMENSEDGKRIYVPITVSKGVLKGNTATVEKFMKLKKYMEKLIVRMGSGIENGDIAIAPALKKGGISPCEYCDYKAACMFDKSTGKNSYRKIEKLSTEEFWEKIEKEEE